MKGGHGPRAARRRDSCTVRNRRTRMSAARFWEGLIPALNYHYTHGPKVFFAAPLHVKIFIDSSLGGGHEIETGAVGIAARPV